jgi:hypothetical protein
LQLFCLIESSLNKIVQKPWAPPKGIDYGGVIGRIVGFALFVSKPKKITTISSSIVASLLEFWSFLRNGLAYIHGVHPKQWAGLNIKVRWSSLAEGPSPHRKGLGSLTLLTVWEEKSETQEFFATSFLQLL